MGWSLKEMPGFWVGGLSLIIYLVLGYLLLGARGDPVAPWLRQPLSVATASANALTLFLLGAGWFFIRAGNPRRHRLLMILALLSISAFLILYVTRQYLVGTLEFGGPDSLYYFVYLPLLIPHLAISAACVPPVLYNAIVGLTREMGEVRKTIHPRVGRIAIPLWMLSSGQGLVIFALLQYYAVV